jgi:hypothetical protein
MGAVDSTALRYDSGRPILTGGRCQEARAICVSIWVRLRIGIAALIALCMAALPVADATAETRVPPGVSGANQYSETLPGPGGNDRTGGGSGGTPAQAIGKGNAAKLEALGPEGKAAAELAARTAPAGAHGGNGGAGTNGSGSRDSGSGSGSSGLDQVLGQVTGTGGSGSGSGGMGLLLPLLIAAAILVAAAYALNRRRAARPQD